MPVVAEFPPERIAGPVAIAFAQLAHEYGLSGPQAYALYNTVTRWPDRRTFARVWGLVSFDIELEA